ncbi:BOLA class I histocompatibility antigen, alpha chain BL3-7-like isoform X3 [Silurus meridionalis]|uniref:BOLA class I histocompatibility antigen, alpha chain BL3-7-like isoform X3 n=1 Tax=Silurus meridionalis TaxID=175797 RepID=UPI001EEC584F|nr:BOLA class I histocompatibility antigen, alpha chain BL3-7-like isoform X3 [Silurus meridionalis]
MRVLFLCTVFFTYGFAEKHSLQYLYIAVQKGNNSPNISQTVFSAAVLLDGEQVMSYNSSERILIPKAWIKETETEDFWSSETQEMQGYHDEFTKKFHMVLKLFHIHTGVHTLQRIYGCEDENNGIVRRYDEYGYDGQDIVSLNLDSKSWSAANGSKTIKGIWKTKEAQFWMSQLETVCTDWFGKFYSKQRKFGPKASLFQKHSPSPEVVCHATGFFPKTMNITWQKDGEDVHENVELSETLPNEDGSFQKRSILKVSAEELQEHTYTCVIEHSSLEKEMVLEVPKGGGLMGIIVGVVVALVVLVAVVAGIVVWKKKNSGFKSVPSRASSEGDSSSNNEDPVMINRCRTNWYHLSSLVGFAAIWKKRNSVPQMPRERT